LMVVRHPYDNAEQFAEQVDLLEYGLVLNGEPVKVNDTDYSFKAIGSNEIGRINVDAFAMFSPHGGGIVVLAMANAGSASATYRSAKLVFDSVTFFAKTVSELEKKVIAFLRGKELYKSVYRSGYSERFTVTLCRDGSFARNASSTSSPGGTLRTNSVGRWSIVMEGSEVILVLSATDGKSFRYELAESTSELKILLNQVTYFVRNGSC